MTKPKLILASTSRFRKSLMENAGLTFGVQAPQIDEREISGPMETTNEDPRKIAEALAAAKALDVSRKFPDAYVIGSDQTMALGSQMFHKPKDLDEAHAHIMSLQGKTHSLHSAVAIARNNAVVWDDIASAHLSMRSLTPANVKTYLERAGEAVLWSVGAYQIKSLGVTLLRKSTVTISPLSDFLCCLYLRPCANWRSSMHDSRETFFKRVFVTGYPVKHSRSPLIHSYWLKTLGIAGEYTRQEVTPEDFPLFISRLKNGESGYTGGNVTIPHKEMALKLADQPDELAKELGAANTLWLEDGRLRATNTDGIGFVSNLDDRHPGWDDTKTAIIYGAGGASRAIIQAVRDRGIGTIHVLNRTAARAQELADRFGAQVHAHPLDALPNLIRGAGLFVNTTSLGMDGEPVPHIDFTPMDAAGIVTDIVYVPLQTPILKMAAEQGKATVDGLGMLLHQAVPGFEKWFGQQPVVDATLRQIIIDDMERTS